MDLDTINCTKEEYKSNWINTSRIAMVEELERYQLIFPVLTILIIVTNLIVVISSRALVKRGQEPRCTYLLLGNVAFADFWSGMTLLCGMIMQHLGFLNHYTCCVNIGFYTTSAIVSIYTVSFIAVDRFLYIVHGLRYNQLMFVTKIEYFIIASWLLGFGSGFMPLYWVHDTMNGQTCWFSMVVSSEGIIIITVLATLPIVLVLILYSLIMYSALSKVIQIRKMMRDAESGRVSNENPNSLRYFRGRDSDAKTVSEIVAENEGEEKIAAEAKPQRKGSKYNWLRNISWRLNKEKYYQNKNDNTPTKWKAIKVVIFTTGGITVAWIPYLIASVFAVHCDIYKHPKECRILKVNTLTRLGLLGIVNSFLNPVIYAWWHNGFRESVKKLFRRKFR